MVGVSVRNAVEWVLVVRNVAFKACGSIMFARLILASFGAFEESQTCGDVGKSE